MKNTGRIKEGLHSKIKEIVFADTMEASIENYLKFSCQVDKAHLLMLGESGLVGKERIAVVLKKIKALEQTGFKSLSNGKIERGIFTHYEDHLIAELSASNGGILQLGRSRNDLNATVSLLRFRPVLLSVCHELIALEKLLLRLAIKYRSTVFPAYTHYQPAVPTTYGHWLLGIAFNLSRTLRDIIGLQDEIDLCPLGACSAGGTSIPINTGTTAKLLGFFKPLSNSVDAVASRNWMLHFMSLLSILCNTISRIANQMLLFSTQEFNFFQLPDSIVGGSSLMPNKRNPFILEHITGKCGKVYGGFTAAISAMHSTLYSNSIAVSQEAFSCTIPAAREALDAMQLLALFMENAKPIEASMYLSNKRGFTQATEMANQLVFQDDLSFREAHKITGKYISRITPDPFTNAVAQSENAPGLQDDMEYFNSITFKTEYGGGPGIKSSSAQINSLAAELKVLQKDVNRMRNHWLRSNEKLQRAVDNFILNY